MAAHLHVKSAAGSWGPLACVVSCQQGAYSLPGVQLAVQSSVTQTLLTQGVFNEPSREKKTEKMQQEHNSKQTSGGVESLQEGINPFCTQGLVPTHYLPTEKIPAGKECGDGV